MVWQDPLIFRSYCPVTDSLHSTLPMAASKYISLNLWFLRPASFEVGKVNCSPAPCHAQGPRDNYTLVVIPGPLEHRVPAGGRGSVEFRALGAAALQLEEVRE